MFYKLRYEYKMRKVLKHILLKKHIPQLSTPSERQILADCMDQGFISGVIGNRVASNDYCIDVQSNVFVTYAGHRFLSHDGMKSTVAIIISLLALLVSLMSNLDKIFNLFS